MKTYTQTSAVAIAAIVLLVVAASGCGHSQSDTAAGTNRANPPVSSLTPQQEEATKAAQQREMEMRGAAERQHQQAQPH